MNNSGPFSWRSSDPDRVGSGLLEIRLRESLDNLSRVFKVSVPQQGRHHDALELLRRWNESGTPLDLSNEAELVRLTAAHRLSWETFLITVAADMDRHNPRTPFTAEKLTEMLGSDLVVEGRNSAPRNMLFELYVAGTLRLPGCSVFDGEPDLLFLYGTAVVSGYKLKNSNWLRMSLSLEM